MYSIEVDYDFFLVRIWPHIRMKGRPHLTSSMVWAEIMNRVKGSTEAHTYRFGYVIESDYLNIAARNAPRAGEAGPNEMSRQDYKDLFEIVMRYERWKQREGAFDVCDVVNHILYNLMAGERYLGPPLHFLMCDEVQDLPPACLLLLARLGNHCFFSGDSAQTIAKGVGFRFSQLVNLFRSSPHALQNAAAPLPVIRQLSVNFRSHGKILDLANCLIKLVELAYPETIDKLKREASWLPGLKPVVLQSSLLEALFGVLVGSEALPEEPAGLIGKPPVEFGCDQVVIVRDQAAKRSLPALLSHALCLTVYEAKGLEFDDVVLYNFFADSPLAGKQWQLLDNFGVQALQYK